MDLSYKKINYSKQDNHEWTKLYRRQLQITKNFAYEGFSNLLKELDLQSNCIPQIEDVSQKLQRKSGWRLAQIDHKISLDEFLNLLVKKVFPVPSIIKKQRIGFNIDADIFHELFGHATMLLDHRYAVFLENLAKVAIECNNQEKLFIEKIYWFTIEIGLLKKQNNYYIYGSALLSAPDESTYAIKSNQVFRKEIDLLSIANTPLIENEFNRYYYYISDLDDLIKLDITHKNINLICQNMKDIK